MRRRRETIGELLFEGGALVAADDPLHPRDLGRLRGVTLSTRTRIKVRGHWRRAILGHAERVLLRDDPTTLREFAVVLPYPASPTAQSYVRLTRCVPVEERPGRLAPAAVRSVVLTGERRGFRFAALSVGRSGMVGEIGSDQPPGVERFAPPEREEK